ncbi:MAG: hypothetical protein M0Z55_03635 [Peptococcaceae bacterium]|nr:hypothetical protein [Peptococcaceae bacterium]
MFKKLTVSVAVLSLTLALAGCGSTPAPKPPAQQPQASAQLPPGHPGSTTGQSAAVTTPKYSQSQVESMVNAVLKKYPGDWKISGTTLSKGSYTENKNYNIVDDIGSAIPGAMVSIFVGDNATRISSTVRMSGSDMNSYPSPPEAAQAIKAGKTISSDAAGMGGTGTYLQVFIPIKSGSKTIGVIMADVPQA